MSVTAVSLPSISSKDHAKLRHQQDSKTISDLHHTTASLSQIGLLIRDAMGMFSPGSVTSQNARPQRIL